MRVLQIIPTLVQGGAEKQLTMLCTGLPRPDFEVHVFVLTQDGPYHHQLREHGIPVSLIEKTWKVDPAAYWRLKRLIARLQPDIVHTWIFAANSYGRQAAAAAKVKHIVAGERCVDRWKAWHEFAIDRYLAGKTERIVTNSSGVQDFYVAHGIPAEKFLLIPNGIESASLENIVPRETLLGDLGLPAGARLVAAVGRLWPQKRYKDLIWSAELLKAARDDTHLLIIGEGPQRSMLESFMHKIGVDDRVHLLGQRSDVAQILSHSDCFWLGSGYEGQSNALMEAMQAGIPAVASDIPGNRDLVQHGQSGFLAELGDSTEFARRTSQLLDDPALAHRIGEAAKRRMRDDFSMDSMIDRHAALYREIAGN